MFKGAVIESGFVQTAPRHERKANVLHWSWWFWRHKRTLTSELLCLKLRFLCDKKKKKKNNCPSYRYEDKPVSVVLPVDYYIGLKHPLGMKTLLWRRNYCACSQLFYHPLEGGKKKQNKPHPLQRGVQFKWRPLHMVLFWHSLLQNSFGNNPAGRSHLNHGTACSSRTVV